MKNIKCAAVKNKTSQRAVKTVDLAGVANRLGISESEARERAFQTYDDVRAQMKGVKHLEERKLVDNAIQGQEKQDTTTLVESPAVKSESTVAPVSSVEEPSQVEVGAHGRFTHLLHKSYPHPETGKPLPAFLTEPSVRRAVGLPEVSPDEAKSSAETQKVRDAIAKRMRAPRSSYLGVNGFQRFIDIHKNSLSNDAIDAYHATVLEHENYSQKLDGFLTHPIADRILSEAQNGQIQKGAKTQLAQIAKQFGVSKASADAALESATSRANQATHAERGSVEPKESTPPIEPSNRGTESNLRRATSATPESTETKPSSINARGEGQRASIEQKKSALLGLLRTRTINRAEYAKRLSDVESGKDINVVTGRALPPSSRQSEAGAVNLSDIQDAASEFRNIVSENLSHLKRSDKEAYEAVLKLAGTQAQVTVDKLQGGTSTYNVTHALNMGDVIITLENAGLLQTNPRTPTRSITVGTRSFPATTVESVARNTWPQDGSRVNCNLHWPNVKTRILFRE
jgi:hypothetical protein